MNTTEEPGAAPARYAQYEDVRAEACRTVPRFVGRGDLNRWEEIARRRGNDWCTAVLGKSWAGIGRSTPLDCEILAVADRLGLDPPLPAEITAAREAAAANERRAAAARERQRLQDLERWVAARDVCRVPVQVRPNVQGRRQGTGVAEGPLRHAVPIRDAVSPGGRRHSAGRALCESPRRAKPLRLADPCDEPATCLRCLAWMPKIRLLSAVPARTAASVAGVPPQPRTPAWGVRVEGRPAQGKDLDAAAKNDLADELGYGTDAYDDAVGPERDHVPVSFYGPYTRNQARRIAELLNQPDVADREQITVAVPFPMQRYIPLPTTTSDRAEETR